MNEQQAKLTELALRKMGRMTQSQIAARYTSSEIHGIWLASLKLDCYGRELSEIDTIARRIYLFSDHRLPEFRNE